MLSEIRATEGLVAKPPPACIPLPVLLAIWQNSRTATAVPPLPSTKRPIELNARVLLVIPTREFLLALTPVPQFVIDEFLTVTRAIPAEVSALIPAPVQFLICVLLTFTLTALEPRTLMPF